MLELALQMYSFLGQFSVFEITAVKYVGLPVIFTL